MSNCNSLSCNHRGGWWGCGSNSCGCGITCGSNTCGCVAGDSTPACNPWAPWGRSGCSCGRCSTCNQWGCGSWNGCGTCGSVAGDTTCGSCSTCGTCSTCGNSPCTCGGWNTCANGASSGYLVPRYQSIGRTFQRRITQTLCVDDIPDCAESPLTLVSVSVSGQAAWEQISECRQQLLRVTVPVTLQIRDCAGRCRTGHSTVTLTIPLCGCSCNDLWRGQLYVAPCIRLAAPVTENEDGCFDATLEVQAEVYLVQMVAINN